MRAYQLTARQTRLRLEQHLDRCSQRPCLRVVGDAREALPELDRSREFAALLVDGADRSGIRLGDDKYRGSMRKRALGC